MTVGGGGHWIMWFDRECDFVNFSEARKRKRDRFGSLGYPQIAFLDTRK